MSIIQDILSGVGVLWDAEKTKINSNFAALNADKAESSTVPTKTSDLTNDSDFVEDADYVATDNNFTTAINNAITVNTAKRSYPSADETRLENTSGTNTGDQDLSDYAETADVNTALADKVDVDGAKVLTEVNFSSADKVLVDTIEDKQSQQTGYGLSQNNYSDADLAKVANLPTNTVTSLAAKADLVSDIVPLAQLPDSVKNAGILYYDDLASFPLTGAVDLLYLAKDTNMLYRWSVSAYVIVTTEVLLDKLDATVDPAVTDDSGDGYAVGSIWVNVTSDDAFICLDSTVGAAVWSSVIASEILDKLDATANPTVNDDSGDGYAVGSTWINVTADTMFTCLDSTVGAAVWQGSGSWDGDITDIDIVGGTDIGANLASTDLFAVYDLSGTVNRKSTLERIYTLIGSLLGANTDDTLEIQMANLLGCYTPIEMGGLDGATIDLTVDDNADNFPITLTENVTSTTFLSGVSDIGRRSFTLFITQGGSGSYTITWPSSAKWAGGTAPTLSTGVGDVDIITFITIDEGTTWYGTVDGLDFS